jgi:NADH-quinone oxidoreductase subunit N
MLLYGMSMVYGFAGTTGFTELVVVFRGDSGVAAGLIVGIVFISAGLAFKVSAVPFHMWTPDVYEGAPTPVTAFFAVAPKIAAIALFVRVMIGPFGDLVGQWQQIVIVTSVLSMALGAFAAINQRNIKRLMAYSSIGHVGYALVGLAAGTEQGVLGVLVYMAIYLAMNVGTFACILCMRVNGRMVEGISDLAGLSRTHPLMAAALAIFMFSMAGIPPLAGFFGKLFVFKAAIDAELYWLAVIGVLTSVVSGFYYLRIVKLMYFDEPAEALDSPIGSDVSLVLVATGLFTLLFWIFPAPIVDAAAAAAATLF